MASLGDSLQSDTPPMQGKKAADVTALSAKSSRLVVSEVSGTPTSAFTMSNQKETNLTNETQSPHHFCYLATSRHVVFPLWTQREELALMLLYTEGSSWNCGSGRGDKFWEKAAVYIQKEVKTSYCRTGLCHIT